MYLENGIRHVGNSSWSVCYKITLVTVGQINTLTVCQKLPVNLTANYLDLNSPQSWKVLINDHAWYIVAKYSLLCGHLYQLRLDSIENSDMKLLSMKAYSNESYNPIFFSRYSQLTQLSWLSGKYGNMMFPLLVRKYQPYWWTRKWLRSDGYGRTKMTAKMKVSQNWPKYIFLLFLA